MKAFTIRWRSARLHREYEVHANEKIAVSLLAALAAGEGTAIWQAGTLWKCPGCGDRTLRTEEFLEGLLRAERYLQLQALDSGDESTRSPASAALAWLNEVTAKMFGCERDRVYLKDEGDCSFENQTYVSRI